jgi:hypothetical protein
MCWEHHSRAPLRTALIPAGCKIPAKNWKLLQQPCMVFFFFFFFFLGQSSSLSRDGGGWKWAESHINIMVGMEICMYVCTSVVLVQEA